MKRALGPLSRLLLATSLLLAVAPAVTRAQDDGARPTDLRSRAGQDPAASTSLRSRAVQDPAASATRTRRAAGKTVKKRKPRNVARAGERRRRTRTRADTHAAEFPQASATAKTEGDTAPATAAAVAQQSAAGVNAQIVKEGATSVKVMEFSGLGIEGRLKSPQLVYFTQRVRAEFERPELPHRSFMPELKASTAREPVR